MDQGKRQGAIVPLPNKIGKQLGKEIIVTTNTVIRDSKGRFAGGVANPRGRPPTGHTFAEAARDLLNSKHIHFEYTTTDGTTKVIDMKAKGKTTFYKALAVVLISQALDGNVRAIHELLDRVEGKVAQRVDVTSNGETVAPSLALTVLNEATGEDIKRLIDAA